MYGIVALRFLLPSNGQMYSNIPIHLKYQIRWGYAVVLQINNPLEVLIVFI